MNRFLSTLLAGAALFGTASAANAGTISGGTVSLSPTRTDLNAVDLGNLSLFDMNLGTLTGVTFTTTYGFTSTITVSATAATTGNTKTQSASNFSSTDTSVNTVLTNLVDVGGPVSLGSGALSATAYDLLGSASNFSLAANKSTQIASNQADQTLTFNDSAPSDLSALEQAGGGTFAIDLTTLTGVDISAGPGSANASQVTDADASMSITYAYTAAVPPTTVPEPASMALFGTGLLGFSLVSRRR